MNISIRRIGAFAVTLFAWLCLAPFAAADEFNYIAMKDTVTKRSDITYLDLALQFAPGLASTPLDASGVSKLRRLGDDPEPTKVAQPSLGGVERVDLTVDGKPALLVMFDLGYEDGSVASVSILALYDMSGKPRLLDAMNVGLDRETSFLETPYLELSRKFGMAFVRNSHHNAGEEYLQTSLIGIWGGKLHSVDTIFTMSWFADGKNLTVLPSASRVKHALAVDLTYNVRTILCPDGCMPDDGFPSTTERVTGRYRWDAKLGKFVRPAKAFDKVPVPNLEE